MSPLLNCICGFLLGGGGGYSHGGGGGGGSFTSGVMSFAARGAATDTIEGRVFIKEVVHTLADSFITSCGAEGRIGPTLLQCQQAYGNSAASRLLKTVDNGVQTFEIKQAGVYTLTAYGARGGHGQLDNPNYRGGDGARVWAKFTFEKGDLLHVVVGQGGHHRTPTTYEDSGSTGGGGGGGTFIWLNDDTMPLLVAGGGGGEFLECFSFC